MANTILITGATGHIGSQVAEELIKRKVPFNLTSPVNL
jgi:uncharacterized protein YbjT (DUF2867 family)